MNLNTLPTASSAAPIRWMLKVGSTVLKAVDWDIEHSGVMEAAEFRANVAAPVSDWAWWLGQTEVLVDVYVGSPPDPRAYTSDDLTLVMTARCDQLNLDVGSMTVRLCGRDLTSLLIDNKTTQKWQNLTSSEIATIIAQLWGFEYSIMGTTTPVGNFYTTDHVKLAKADTYWNVLTYLAQREGFQVFVLGRVLYFGTYGSQSGTAPYLIQVDTSGAYPTSNAEELNFAHDLTLAQDISVTVRSYHGMLGAAFSGTATASKTAKKIEQDARVAQALQHYDFVVPGLTQPQCVLKANQILGDLSTHELKMSARLPMDTLLYPWVQVKVAGTGTMLDALYVPSSVRRFGNAGGCGMSVSARAGVPQATVTLA